MTTYQLDPVNWDRVTANGQYVLLTGAAATAQDVACAIRTWLGEVWYDTTLGMPYAQSIMGQSPTSSFLKSQIKKAAQTIPEVTGVTSVNLQVIKRRLTGSVFVTTSTSKSPIEVTF